MMSSSDFLLTAMRHELDAINEYLIPAGIKEEKTGELSVKDLSRSEAEQVELREIGDAIAKKSMPALAAAMRLAHEANRAKRDITIAESSHKKLMLGIYRTMYQRKLKLERRIQEET